MYSASNYILGFVLLIFPVLLAFVWWFRSRHALHALDVVKQTRSDFCARIVESVVEGIFTLKDDGTIVDLNSAAETLYGYTSGALLGKNISILIPDKESIRSVGTHSIGANSAAGEVNDFSRFDAPRGDAFALRENGSLFLIEWTLSALGVEGLYVLLVRDNTERKQGEDANLLNQRLLELKNQELEKARDVAEQAAGVKDAFLATMSHELRTPLNAIIGMSDLLMDMRLTDEQMDAVQMITGSGEHLITIIDDILDYSKIESGALVLEPVAFDLNTLVEDVAVLMDRAASAKKLEIVTWVHAACYASVIGDAARIRQILINLVANAIKFSASGEVLLRVTQKSETSTQLVLNISVTDQGIGMEPEVLSRLFKAFSQVDTSTSRKYGGSGLGLAICKEMLGLMDSEIKVLSTAGEGSVFYFELTLDKDLGVDKTPSKALDAVPASIVGDSTMASMLFQYMREWGMQVDIADRLPVQNSTAGKLVVVAGPKLEVSLKILDEISNANDSMQQEVIFLLNSNQFNWVKHSDYSDRANYIKKPIRISAFRDLLGGITQGPTVDDVSDIENTSKPVLDSKSLQTPHLKILLAEDNLINQKVALKMFKKLGHTPELVINGVEAVEAVRCCVYDMIFMDCQMPEMDGLEATGKIRKLENGGKVPIIALTANTLQGDRERCINAGMNDFVGKPCKLANLEIMLRKWNLGFGTGKQKVNV